MTTITPVRLNHVNLVLEDFDASVAHLTGTYGAEFMADIPNPETHACLIAIARVIIEVFTPRAWLLNARYGAHHVGIEYQADMAQVRAAIAERGIRIVRDIGLALHTHPADCFGIAFEFYDGSFHEREWEPLGGRTIRAAAYWRDEQPLALTGLAACVVGVWELEKARDFLVDFIGGVVVGEIELRPGIGARALAVRVADEVLELLAPTGAGWWHERMVRHGEGIHATAFATRDLKAVARVLGDRGIVLEPGTAPGSLGVPAAVNCGVVFEFRAD